MTDGASRWSLPTASMLSLRLHRLQLRGQSHLAYQPSQYRLASLDLWALLRAATLCLFHHQNRYIRLESLPLLPSYLTSLLGRSGREHMNMREAIPTHTTSGTYSLPLILTYGKLQ